MSHDYLLKIFIIGDSNVGKSSLMLRFVDDNFSQNYISTIGIDFKVRTLIMDDKKVKLQIWDTAGQERFCKITTSFLRGAMGIMIVYDVTDRVSLGRVTNWVKYIDEQGSNAKLILVGNKIDHRERDISFDEGLELANKYGLDFIETSAFTGENVQKAFLMLASSILKSLDVRGVSDKITFEKENNPSCC